jgi:O-succinylbenzoic acid--CoA ligase
VNVESWLARAARSHPDRLAVNTLSYADLLARASALAAGLEPGQRVGIAIPPGEEFAVALHGTLLAGAVAVPIDLRSPERERPSVDLLAAEQGEVSGKPDTSPCSAVFCHDLDATAVVVQTSGTTSEPKPVALTYGNLLWSALGSAVALGAGADERWLCAMPLTHVGGLSVLFRSVIYGTTAVVHEHFDTEAVLRELSDPDGPTLFSAVPTMLARLLDTGLQAPPALRTVLLGGAQIPPGLLEQAARSDVPVTPTYGLTEACSQVTTDGLPLFCTTVSLGADGEVLVGGPTVAEAGKDPDDGLLHTGDIGRFARDGRLQIVGRLADTIITGGENVAPAEVEAVLDAHPAVVEAAVVARADPEWGEAIVAIVRTHPGGSVEDAELDAHCRSGLAAYKCPKDYVRTAEPLPRTGSGKLLRRKIDLDD